MPILKTSTEVSAGTVVDAVEAWNSATLTWTDANGSSWNLADPSGGVVAVGSGITGLSMPPITRYTSTAPAIAGSRWKGFRIEEREVSIPILVFSDTSSVEWVTRDRLLWAGLRPDMVGTLAYTSVDGVTRSLRCRYSDDATHSVSSEPSRFGWDLYDVTLVADEEPLWLGAPMTWSFTALSSYPFFDTTGGVIYISSSASIASATISNPGDVPAYPVWEVTGPVTSGLVLGVGGGTITYSSSIASGDTVTFNADPRVLSVTDQDGTDLSANASWKVLGAPAGSPVPLSITAAGTSSSTDIGVTLTPRYYRAW